MATKEARFWKLYRRERAKLASPSTPLTPPQIVHAARSARKQLDGEK